LICLILLNNNHIINLDTPNRKQNSKLALNPTLILKLVSSITGIDRRVQTFCHGTLSSIVRR
jgi:hypothetical protein